MSQLTPEVLWAQRSSSSDPEKNFIYLTISVPDVSAKDITLTYEPTSLKFHGYSETLKRTYHLELSFFAEIDTNHVQIHHTARNIEMKLRKKVLSESYWDRLLKDPAKVQFLKTDFDKWVDEDEQNEVAEDDFSQFGGMGGMPGMNDMSGMGEMAGLGGGDFGGIDFSKLGGGAGAAGGEDDEDDDDDDDDEMPSLQDDDDVKDDNKPE
ncbi:HSP20-like chaperone [Xylaria sp. CBS 124048]|nr:HSP20-like chaperone [Xylaria sp. CBS 124048]